MKNWQKMILITFPFIILAIVAWVTGLYYRSDTLDEVICVEEPNHYQITYKGENHKLLVFLPMQENKNPPLIIMLHGYGNDSTALRNDTHMDVDGNERGYIVAYIDGTTDKEHGIYGAGWNSGLGDSAKDDMGLINAVVSYLQQTYHCGVGNTYAVGFSNGGVMTQRLAVEASDTFQAVVSVAGLMPKKVWDKRKNKADISVLEIYGSMDDVVPKKSDGSDEKSIHPAIEDVMNYWVDANGLEYNEEAQLSGKVLCSKYSSEQSKHKVWNIIIDGGRHAWPDGKYTGVDINSIILDFLDSTRSY